MEFAKKNGNIKKMLHIYNKSVYFFPFEKYTLLISFVCSYYEKYTFQLCLQIKRIDSQKSYMRLRKSIQEFIFLLTLQIIFHMQGGTVATLSSLRNEADVSGVILIAPAFAPNPETATFFRVSSYLLYFGNKFCYFEAFILPEK